MFFDRNPRLLKLTELYGEPSLDDSSNEGSPYNSVSLRSRGFLSKNMICTALTLSRRLHQYYSIVLWFYHSSSMAWNLPLSSSAVPQILCEAWCSARPKL